MWPHEGSVTGARANQRPAAIRMRRHSRRSGVVLARDLPVGDSMHDRTRLPTGAKRRAACRRGRRLQRLARALTAGIYSRRASLVLTCRENQALGLPGLEFERQKNATIRRLRRAGAWADDRTAMGRRSSSLVSIRRLAMRKPGAGIALSLDNGVQYALAPEVEHPNLGARQAASS